MSDLEVREGNATPRRCKLEPDEDTMSKKKRPRRTGHEVNGQAVVAQLQATCARLTMERDAALARVLEVAKDREDYFERIGKAAQAMRETGPDAIEAARAHLAAPGARWFEDMIAGANERRDRADALKLLGWRGQDPVEGWARAKVHADEQRSREQPSMRPRPNAGSSLRGHMGSLMLLALLP